MEIFKKLESLGFFNWLDKEHNLRDTDMNPEYLDNLSLTDIHRTVANSMVFRWFREKYRLMSCITPCSDGEYIFTLYDLNKCNLEVFVEDIELFESEDSYDICEEAELACLIKLIEIVENEKV